MATYAGTRVDSCTEIIVTKDGVVLDPTPSQNLFNHSPDGFNWGFGGSGPAQLALALLLDSGIEQPLQLYQKFKFAIVGGLDDTWEMTTEEIQGWCKVARMLEKY